MLSLFVIPNQGVWTQGRKIEKFTPVHVKMKIMKSKHQKNVLLSKIQIEEPEQKLRKDKQSAQEIFRYFRFFR